VDAEDQGEITPYLIMYDKSGSIIDSYQAANFGEHYAVITFTDGKYTGSVTYHYNVVSFEPGKLLYDSGHYDVFQPTKEKDGSVKLCLNDISNYFSVKAPKIDSQYFILEYSNDGGETWNDVKKYDDGSEYKPLTGYKVGDVVKIRVKENENYHINTGEELTITFEKYEFPVTFNINGHGSAPANQTIDRDGKVVKPDAPSENGFAFAGWYKEEGCINQWDFENDKVTDDTTLYAKWEANKYTNTLKYDANGGSNAPAKESDTVAYPNTKKSFIISSAEPTAYSKEGYKVSFAGWYTAKEGGSKVSSTVEVGEDNKTEDQSLTIFAHWLEEKIPTTYTVSFSANGHGSAPASQIVEMGKQASKPTDLTLEGYSFGGWYKEEACTNAYDFNSAVTSDIVLYAKWTKAKEDKPSEENKPSEEEVKPSEEDKPSEESSGNSDKDSDKDSNHEESSSSSSSEASGSSSDSSSSSETSNVPTSSAANISS